MYQDQRGSEANPAGEAQEKQLSPLSRRQLFMSWALVISWMIVIFVFSSQSNSNQVTEQVFGGINYWVRKSAHMLEYAILFGLCRLAIAQSLSSSQPGSKSGSQISAGSQPADLPWAAHGFLALIVTIIYAASDEWHQSFVPGRSACLEDVGIDALSALAAWLVLSQARRFCHRIEGQNH